MKYRTLLTSCSGVEPKGICVVKFPPRRPQPSHLVGPGSPCFVLLTQISQLLAHVFSERKSVSWLQNLGHLTGKFRIHRVKLVHLFTSLLFYKAATACSSILCPFLTDAWMRVTYRSVAPWSLVQLSSYPNHGIPPPADVCINATETDFVLTTTDE